MNHLCSMFCECIWKYGAASTLVQPECVSFFQGHKFYPGVAGNRNLDFFPRGCIFFEGLPREQCLITSISMSWFSTMHFTVVFCQTVQFWATFWAASTLQQDKFNTWPLQTTKATPVQFFAFWLMCGFLDLNSSSEVSNKARDDGPRPLRASKRLPG